MALCGFHSSSQAAIYSFTEIDTTQGLPIDGFIDIAINDAGKVVYSAFLDEGGMGIFVGNGGQPDHIVDTSGNLRRVEFPSINNHGDVGFVGTRNEITGPTDDVVLRYNQSSGTFTEIAEMGDFFGALCCSTGINNAGAVAFSGIIPTVVAAGTGGAPLIVVPDFGPTFAGVGISVNGSTFEVAYTELRSGQRRKVVKGSSLVKTTIVDSAVSPFAHTNGVTQYKASINDFGEVGFSAPLTTGVQGVYISNGATTTTIADSSGGFDEFSTVSISRFHTVFEARSDFTDTRGIYAGPNPTAGRVIRSGDGLAGFPSTASVARISSTSVNDSGQVAMIVSFANGRTRVLRADPLGVYLALDDVAIDYAVSAMTATQNALMSQMVDLRGDRFLIILDYLFATNTGKLEVRLGGRTLATIEAPRRIASEFTTFKIPVDTRRIPPRVRSLRLKFVLHGNGVESGVLLDNIEFPGVENGDFGTGDLTGWKSRVSHWHGAGRRKNRVSHRHGAVGVAVAPNARSNRLR